MNARTGRIDRKTRETKISVAVNIDGTGACRIRTGFGFADQIQRDLAELIRERKPWIEKMRFCSSGTEATTAAIRVARGFTGRDDILKFDGCYHGAGDPLLVKAGSGALTFGNPSSAGVPADTDDPELARLYEERAALAGRPRAGAHPARPAPRPAATRDVGDGRPGRRPR